MTIIQVKIAYALVGVFLLIINYIPLLISGFLVIDALENSKNIYLNNNALPQNIILFVISVVGFIFYEFFRIKVTKRTHNKDTIEVTNDTTEERIDKTLASLYVLNVIIAFLILLINLVF